MKNCKFCGAEMEDELTVCPGCGKDISAEEAAAESVEEIHPATEETAAEAPEVSEEPAAPEEGVPVEKKKGITGASAVALAVAAVVLLAAIIAVLVMNGKKQESEAVPSGEATQSTEQTQPMTVPEDGNPDDVTCKGTYTVTDEEAIAARDQVVATAGSHTLTNGQLQVHYWLGVQQFYAQYGSYAAYLGLDHTLPMDTQVCGMEENRTWQQYFLEQALDSWKVYEAVAQAAEKDGFQLPAELLKELDELEAGLGETAAANGFDDAEHMLKFNFGNAVTLQDYKDYWKLYYSGSFYYNEVLESSEPAQAELEDFFAENEAAYKEKGLTKETCTVDVRHILVTPENPNADGSFPEESWAAAEKKAQELLDAYLAGDKTEDSFAVLANENSTDPGSNTNGGLYQGVNKGEMVESFDAWCFDAARKPGDTGIVKTTYGYHVMYYVNSRTVWQDQVKSDILAQKSAEFVDEALAAVEASIDYSAIKLALVDMS